ncbi:hypothetical protein SAMN05444695_1062 [Rhodococcus triatomae]|uniref:Uncharacterized protein n=1 Tax=Rhodococcus triatomae TaxID=300028 RepID=A0A1G8IXS4_9NOCA|nr:hypothetical protein SAMN05444695_1062 [Rhodococcus triatomae]
MAKADPSLNEEQLPKELRQRPKFTPSEQRRNTPLASAPSPAVEIRVREWRGRHVLVFYLRKWDASAPREIVHRWSARETTRRQGSATDGRPIGAADGIAVRRDHPRAWSSPRSGVCTPMPTCIGTAVRPGTPHDSDTQPERRAGRRSVNTCRRAPRPLARFLPRRSPSRLGVRSGALDEAGQARALGAEPGGTPGGVVGAEYSADQFGGAFPRPAGFEQPHVDTVAPLV